uniref:Uncharacterized protein n=1 Tax=Opuntia streptacantha TaxID=393608 RepID=A0A7C9AC39_OPUST
MVDLMRSTLIPPQTLAYLPKLPAYSSVRVRPHAYFSVINVYNFSSFPTQRLYPWPIWIQQSNSVFLRSNGSKNAAASTEIGALFSLFQSLGFDEKKAEAILSRNPDIGSSDVEFLRNRIRGLQSVGLEDFVLAQLISKYPDTLTAKEVGSLIKFIHGLDGKIEPLQIERLLLRTEPRFLAGFDKKVELLLRHGIPQEKIVHVLNNVSLSKAICLRSVQEIESVLTFLSRYEAVGIIAKRPSLLNYDLNTQLVPRVGVLQKLSGGDEDGVGQVLNRLPAILTYASEHLQSQVEGLRKYAGLSDQEIFKIVLLFPNVMSVSKERKLRPRIDFLKECGLEAREIYRLLLRGPAYLGLSFEKNLAHKLAMLVKIGYSFRTKELAMAMAAATRTTPKKLQEVISIFLSCGFSSDNILEMSTKHYPILQYNPRSVERKIEYLTEVMDREIEALLSFPAFLGYNLDSRIRHRHELRKKVGGEDMSLNKLMTVSAERFSKTKKYLAHLGGKAGVEDSDTD